MLYRYKCTIFRDKQRGWRLGEERRTDRMDLPRPGKATACGKVVQRWSRCNCPASRTSNRRVPLAKKIRGVAFEENLDNSMGLEFYNLSHRFGYQSPNWP